MSDAGSRSPGPSPRFSSSLNSPAAVGANEARRRHKHGRVLPMHEPSLLERLLKR